MRQFFVPVSVAGFVRCERSYSAVDRLGICGSVVVLLAGGLLSRYGTSGCVEPRDICEAAEPITMICAAPDTIGVPPRTTIHTTYPRATRTTNTHVLGNPAELVVLVGVSRKTNRHDLRRPRHHRGARPSIAPRTTIRLNRTRPVQQNAECRSRAVMSYGRSGGGGHTRSGTPMVSGVAQVMAIGFAAYADEDNEFRRVSQHLGVLIWWCWFEVRRCLLD